MLLRTELFAAFGDAVDPNQHSVLCPISNEHRLDLLGERHRRNDPARGLFQRLDPNRDGLQRQRQLPVCLAECRPRELHIHGQGDGQPLVERDVGGQQQHGQCGADSSGLQPHQQTDFHRAVVDYSESMGHRQRWDQQFGSVLY